MFVVAFAAYSYKTDSNCDSYNLLFCGIMVPAPVYCGLMSRRLAWSAALRSVVVFLFFCSSAFYVVD